MRWASIVFMGVLLLALLGSCAGDTETRAAVERLNTDLREAIGNVQADASTGRQWEYSLDVIVYDEVCAAAAIAPFANDETVKDRVGTWGTDRDLMGALHMAYEFMGKLSGEDWYAISDKYLQCGQDFFQTSLAEMGDERWEMINYERLQYTFPGIDQYYSGVIIDYGYEVMWKRPKVSE